MATYISRSIHATKAFSRAHNPLILRNVARTYATAAPPHAKATAAAPKVVRKFPAARASTAAATSSAGDSNGNAASEAPDYEAEAAATSVPSESIPSSSALSDSTVPNFVSDSMLESGVDGTSGTPGTDWSKSYHGLAQQPFPKEAAEVLLSPIDAQDIEVKPDGLLYLPEIKYRRVLNRAFGPGGWGLAPRSGTHVSSKIVSREYALICLGRLVAVARGEQEYFDVNGIATATEACKSNALMRCCKDLGVASELWDPRFIREFKAQHCVEVFVEHQVTRKKRKLWRRKDQPKFDYPFKE